MQTPYYLIKKAALDAGVNNFLQAMENCWGPRHALAYSFKTNSLPWLLRHLRELGCIAEVVSSAEYELALKTGFKKENIVFNGPVKGKPEFLDAILSGSIVNLDSQRELCWLEEMENIPSSCRIGLRVNFSVEDACPDEIGYEDEGTRFGFSSENGALALAVERLNALGVKISGLHMHSTSKTRSLNVYKALAAEAARVIPLYNLEPDYIDIGGGYFGGMPGKPSFAQYVSVIRDELGSVIDPGKVMLIVEPGSAVIGAFVDFVTTVVDVKDNAKSRFVTIDGSRFNVDPLMIKSRHFYRTDSEAAVFAGKQIICGYTCMDKDRIMRIEDGAELKVGDRLIFEKVGSYTMALSPLFINYFPAVYLDDEQSTCVRRAWTADDYTKE
ncbi:MAG: pyridoxal-dependent decarboxylase [Oscillospiraceae bacterium]|nr:pyridoxal-dependent decarboxylase [Oscillospiraceae bacterium]